MANHQGKNYVVANWKMNLLSADSAKLAAAFKEASVNLKQSEVWVAPSATAIPAVAATLTGSPVRYGAQNVYAPEGAFTGEVSVSMLKEFGCSFAIVGHSERRHVFGETDTLVAKRTTVALQNGLGIIFCIGEKLDERDGGQTKDVLARQVKALLDNVKDLDQSLLLLAYEPVWAIGTGKVATLEEIEDAHSYVVKFWKEQTGKVCPPILYGGSVTPDNYAPIIRLESVAGSLVGGASLSIDKFGKLIEISEGV